MLTYSDQNTSTITYSYDAFGRRVRAEQTGSTTRYWLYGASGGNHPVAEYSGAWQTNIEVGGTTVATVDSANNVTYLALSMLKTAKMTVNGAGSPSGVATYYPYGAENASITAEYKFTNQIRDPNGIDHFWMRSYSATLGRWLTPDPAGLAAVDPGDPQSWNRYAYVLNDPASAFDPLGLVCQKQDGSTSPLSKEQCLKQGNIWGDYNGTAVTVSGGMGGTVPLADPSGVLGLLLDAPKAPILNGQTGSVVSGHGVATSPSPQPNGKQPPCAPPTAAGSVVYKAGVPPASPRIQHFMLCVSACMGGIPFRATSTSDSHPPSDPHSRGLAVDGTIPGIQGEVMLCGANCGAKYEQNEFRNPSRNATGGHFHFQLVPGRGGALGPIEPTCHY